MSEDPNDPSPFQKMFSEFRERLIRCQIDVTMIPAPRRSIVYIDLIPVDCMPRDKFTLVKPLFGRYRKFEGVNSFVFKPIKFEIPFESDHGVEAIAKEHDGHFWPHKKGCPLCGNDAYVGFARVECCNTHCANWFHREEM